MERKLLRLSCLWQWGGVYDGLLRGRKYNCTKAGNGKSVVTVWAGGSDNVRVQFEKQIETFNASPGQV